MKTQKYLIILFLLISFGCQPKPDLVEEFKTLEELNQQLQYLMRSYYSKSHFRYLSSQAEDYKLKFRSCN